jgi:SAM-dependent methyltransferase
VTRGNPYETQKYVEEYLLFHYGKPQDFCPFPFVSRDLMRFHERIREESILRLPSHKHIRALDIGCGTGRLSFELAQVADEVIGIDNSRAFIDAAKTLSKKRRMSIRVHESGSEFAKKTIVLPKHFQQARVQFGVGNAMDLRAFRERGPYGIVAAINLICRLPSPRRFLRQLKNLIEPGGQLILASPFSWLGGFTPRHEWFTPEAVVKTLQPQFRLARQRDLPFMIREHRRKYQLVVSKVMTLVRTQR